MRACVRALAAASVLLCGQAAAQPGAGLGCGLTMRIENATPETRAEALALLSSMGTNARIRQAYDQARAALVPQLTRSSRLSQAEVTAILDDTVLPGIETRAPRLIAGIAELYAGHFTTSELRQLRAFYDSPVGQKLKGLEPVLGAMSQTVAEQWLQQSLTEVFDANRESLRQRGLRV